MNLIDVRETAYGKVVDVKLDNADLSFSMPYAEYKELESRGQLNDENAIDSNIRFMTQIKTAQFIPSEAEARASHADWLDWNATRESDYPR